MKLTKKKSKGKEGSLQKPATKPVEKWRKLKKPKKGSVGGIHVSNAEKLLAKFPEVLAPQSRPIWRFRKFDWEGGWCWPEQRGSTFILQKLASFESMTWDDILVKAKKQHHSIDFEKLSPVAQRRLEKLDLYVDGLVSLRLTGTHRVFGYRSGDVLYVLWSDPEHEVCPSKKKHT